MRHYLTGPIASGKSTRLAQVLAALPADTPRFGYSTRWQAPQSRGRGQLLVHDFAHPDAPPLPLDPRQPDAPATLLAVLIPLLKFPSAATAATGGPVLAIDELGLLELRAPPVLLAQFCTALRRALEVAADAYLIVQQRALPRWRPLLPPAPLQFLPELPVVATPSP